MLVIVALSSAVVTTVEVALVLAELSPDVVLSTLYLLLVFLLGLSFVLFFLSDNDDEDGDQPWE